MSNAVDFNNPESIAAELEAADVAAVTKAPKAKKEPKPKMVTCPHCGETYELPKSVAVRGVVAGIPVEEMTEEQLKIEYRNANSVFYKTQKAGNDVTKAKARLDAVKAVMDAKGIHTSTRTVAPVTAESIAALIKAGQISVEDLQAALNG